MKRLYIVAAIFALAGCAQRVGNPNRLYFFENESRAIIVPVKINDSVVANAFLDTGASNVWVSLDSTFCAKNQLVTRNKSGYHSKSYSVAWAQKGDEMVDQTSYYEPISVEMCGVKMLYDRFRTTDNSTTGRFDACFSWSANDTTHVWELNFEHNYMEAHEVDRFTMPADCRVIQLAEAKQYPISVRFPIEVTSPDGTTTTIEETYIIDTGMLLDLVLFESAADYEFFNRRGDSVLLNHWTDRRYDVEGEVFDGIKLDKMRVYLNNKSFMLQNEECKGVIGINFLKRFNVFFDLYRRQIGFQPIKKPFKRIVNPDLTRRYVNLKPTENGYWQVLEVLDTPDNPYKKAGMEVGDIIKTVNRFDVSSWTIADWMEVNRTKWRDVTILRDGKPMLLRVRFKELGE